MCVEQVLPTSPSDDCCWPVKGEVGEICVSSAILQASEKLAMVTDTLNSLHSDDWAMIH